MLAFIAMLKSIKKVKKMKCVIIAAGKGSRLQNRAQSKPLMPVLGVPLIERVIREVAHAGIDEFCVITGYQASTVKDFLTKLSLRTGLSITTVYNPEWEKAQNGVSVLQARDFVKEDAFILLMCDHLFDGTIIQTLLGAAPKKDEVVLAIDRNLKNPLVNLQDVTKAKEENNKIININKQLTNYNAFDTGIFYCSSQCFNALEACQQQGKTSWTDAVALLAKQNKMLTCDIGSSYWIDVDDPTDASKAKDTLLKHLRSKSNDGPVSRYLNRPISIRISKWLANKKITPNQISLAAFVFSIIAALLFAIGYYPLLILGGLIAQFASIIDGCDGEIARLKYQSSQYGGWLDAVLDRYADAFLLFGLTIYAYQYTAWPMLALLIGFLAIIGSFVLSYTADKYDRRMQKKICTGFHFRMGRDIRVLLILLFVLVNQVFWGLLIIALLMNSEVVRRLWVCQYE